MVQQNKRFIGQILIDGGFVPRQNIEAALEEQKKTNELLGQVLVRMKILDPVDIKVALSVQDHLDRVEDAAKIAAGVRRLLGDLLVQAGHITTKQLKQAIDEQKRSGEKLGEVLVRQGLLTKRQLYGVLDYQQNQSLAKPAPGPLRLGEILISAGTISRRQLANALRKQVGSRKKLGEILVEEGYALPHHIHHGMRVQQMLLTAVLVALLAACGGGGSQASSGAATAGASTGTGTAVTASNVDQNLVQANFLTVTYDEYGLIQPNYYYSTNNDAYWSIQSDVAEDVWDTNFKTVLRIDIPKSGGVMPSIGGKTFAIEDNAQYEKFPGAFLVFNGEKSTLKKVSQGTISFSPESTATEATGDFDVTLTDNDSALIPSPQYHLKGIFNFKMGTSNSASPLSAAVS
jgi:mannitol/fructose-specific phosphotransferase system IIA component (Ntr-type)